MDNDKLQQSAQKHQDRNAALREKFLEKKVDMRARITQSIDLTMRPEFITDLVRIADSNAAVFDGWGTLLER